MPANGLQQEAFFRPPIPGVLSGARLWQSLSWPHPCFLDVYKRQVSDDGVIEAIAHEGRAFCLAVQWHPEMMPDCPNSRKLFRAFVEAAKEKI